MMASRIRFVTLAFCPLCVMCAAGCGTDAGDGAPPAAVAAAAPAAPVQTPDSTRPERAAAGPIVLVAYYTETGMTRRMAVAVAEGARRVAGTNVILASIDSVRPSDLRSADAIVLGSPTHWANMATPMRAFIDSWPGLGLSARDRIGGAFATGGGSGGGKEMVVTSLLLAMLNHGMVVVGPIFEEGGVAYGNFGVAAATGPATDQALADTDLESGRALGRRVAEVAAAFRARD